MEVIPTKAERIIKKSTISSMAAGAVPVPIIDVALVMGIQMKMLQQLCEVYEVNYSTEKMNAWIASILSGTLLMRFGGSALKTMPGLGWLAGGATLALTSGASTFAIGNIAMGYLAEGQSFVEMDAKKAKEEFKKEFEKGKAFVKDLKDEKPDNEEDVKPSNKKAKALIETLNQLKVSGIISEKEFAIKERKVWKLYEEEE